MIPFLLANRRMISYGLAVAALALALWRVVDNYGDRREAAGRASVQSKWDADVVARDKVTNEAIRAVSERETAARAANEVIVDEYQAKLVAAAGERDGYFGMLQRARGEVRSCAGREATGALIAATAGEASIAERIDRAVAGVIVESKQNADQLDALIDVVNAQK